MKIECVGSHIQSNKQTKKKSEKNQQIVSKQISKTIPYYEHLAELQTVCHEYWKRICGLEGDKFDLERASALKKMEVKRLNATIKLNSFLYMKNKKKAKYAEKVYSNKNDLWLDWMNW